MAAEKVDCPVCGKSFSIRTINSHVNECLKVDEDKNSLVITPDPIMKRKKQHNDDDSACGGLSDGGVNDDDGDGGSNNNNNDDDGGGVGNGSSSSNNNNNDDDGGGVGARRSSWGSLIPYSKGSKKSKLDNSPKLNRKHTTNSSSNSSSSPNNNNNTNRKCKSSSFLNADTLTDKEIKGSNPGKEDSVGTTRSTRSQLQSPYSTATSSNTNTNTNTNTSTCKPPGEEGGPHINFNIPLAEICRPKTMQAFVGQKRSLGEKSFIRNILLNCSLPPSIIFWGPPGSGKTTLAKLISNQCKEKLTAKLVMMSATNSGVNDVKQAVQNAKTNQKMFKTKTIVFIDEIHRFNKTQQDSLLPHVEDGTFILLGATTENPSFHVNSSLLSRCHVVVLEKLSMEEVSTILQNAVESLNIKCFSHASEIDKLSADKERRPDMWINNKAIEEMSFLCDGDGRVALNCLQMAVQSQTQKNTGATGDDDVYSPAIIDVDCVKESLERSCILYDKKGEEHYNCASALQKSIRGSDADAAVYWVARMLEGGEDPLFIARRLVRTASEDIGLSDPLALTQAVAAFQATTFLGMPDCDVILAQCAVYLARTSKSFEACSAYGKAKRCIHEHKGPLPSVPLHLRNAPTGFMKSLGYGRGYVGHGSDNTTQTYLPPELLHMKFLDK